MKSSYNNLLKPPFIYTRLTVFKTHLFIIICLGLHFLLLALSGDFFSMLNILLSVVGCFSVDLLLNHATSQRIEFNITTFTTGLLIGFFMPSGIGVLFVFFVSGLSFFITKMIFGGTGSNWVNPVAIAICIAYISRQEFFPKILDFELLHTYGGLLPALDQIDFSKIKIDFTLTSALNSLLLHNVGVTLPEGYISLFYNSTAIIPAFRYNIVTLLCSIPLFAFKVVDHFIPTSFLITYSLLIWIFGGVTITGSFFSGDILFALLTSGILFVAIFVLTESSSSPKTKLGKVASGILNGVFAFLICKNGAAPAGMGFVIILSNVITPVIEKLEKKIIRKKRILYG